MALIFALGGLLILGILSLIFFPHWFATDDHFI
jgi:hypothetical protein